MTTEEAAATLGLAPEEITAEAVERNYREKAKHCHPDRASYPGAAAEFKRATLAFDTLRSGDRASDPRPSTPSAVEVAAEGFRWVLALKDDEIFAAMGWWERAISLAGARIRPIGTDQVPQGVPLLVRTLWRYSTRGLIPLVVAPIDVEVLGTERRGDEFRMTLRPMETDRVEDHLEQSIAEGLSLAEACRRLERQLDKAARAPLFSPQPLEGRAA